jgi:hypothetical protein
VSLALPVALNVASDLTLSFNANLALNSNVDMHWEEQQNSREKKPSQKLFVLLKRVDSNKDETRGKKSTTQDVQRDEYSSLKNVNACSFKFDDAEHPNDEENCGESNQGIGHHSGLLSMYFFLGART